MPRAFTRRRSTFVWIDPQNGWFVVDAGSPAALIAKYGRDDLEEVFLDIARGRERVEA